MTITRGALLAATIILALVRLPLPAGAAVDEANLHIDLVPIEGVDRSSEPLAGWDDIGLDDNARTLLRTPDRVALRLLPGRDARSFFAPVPFAYDDMNAMNAKRLLLHAPEHNTLRNFLILMFLTGDN